MTRILTAIVLVLLFSGCLATSVMPVNKKAMEDLMVSRKQESERVALALGDRIIQKDAEQVYSAFITALSELGLAIKNAEKESGYIYAEGESPLPADEQRALCEQGIAEAKKVAGGNGIVLAIARGRVRQYR